jgi:8-oxo-dGTP pyrophosphatase MutT (NUDIX family)
MHLKIYFGDKPLFLCDAIDDTVNEYLHHDDAMFLDELSTPALNSMLYEMSLEKIHAGVFFHPDLEALKKAFWKKMKVMPAGGGLIVNEKQEILLIFRRGKWDLPKGKLDPGETMEQCALREVMEETGLQHHRLVRPLPTTYHTYTQNGKLILKESHWFLMEAPSTDTLKAQTEEDIEEIGWVPQTQLAGPLSNAFLSIKDVINGYLAETL